jgi:hypothetical protein
MGCCKGNTVYTYYTVAGVKLSGLLDSFSEPYPSGNYCGVTDINYSVDEVEPIYRYFQHATPNTLAILGAPFSNSAYITPPSPISQLSNKQGVQFMVGGSYNYTYSSIPEKIGNFGLEITCQSNPCIDEVGVGGYYFDLKVNGISASGYPIQSYKTSAAGSSSSLYALEGCKPTSPATSYLINWSGIVKSDSGRIKKGDDIEVSIYPDPSNIRSYPVFIETLGTKDGYNIPFDDGTAVNQTNYPYGLCGNYIQFLPGSWQKTVVDSFTWPNIFDSPVDYNLVDTTLVGYKDCFLESDVVVKIPEASKLPDKVKLTISLVPCPNPILRNPFSGPNPPPYYKQSIYDVASKYVSSLSKSIEVELFQPLQNGTGSKAMVFGTYKYKQGNTDRQFNTYLTVQAFANTSVDNGTFTEEDFILKTPVNQTPHFGYLDSTCLKSSIENRGNNYFYLVYISSTQPLLNLSCLNSQGIPAFIYPECFYPRNDFGFRFFGMGNCAASASHGSVITNRITWLNCLTDGLMRVPVITKEKNGLGQIVEVLNLVSVFYKIELSSEEIFSE